MSNNLNPTSNAVDPTIEDPRIEHIAEYTGLSPESVLGHVQEDAAADGNTVDEELSEDDATVSMIEALGSM